MYKMIIVDDEKFIIERLKTVIDWSALNISIVGDAYDGNQAIELTKMLNPEIVLTDIRMPDMNGLQLSDYLSRHYPKINVVLVSAYDDFEYAKKAIEYGIKGYLLKPVSSDEVSILFKRVLGIDQHRIDQNEVELSVISNSHILIGKAEKYINAHYEQKITLEEVANYLYINPSYLCYLFKKVKNINFIDYVTSVRIQIAKKNLKILDLKVKDIAVKTGFSDYTYFCKVFRKSEGVTPLGYRAKLFLENDL